MRFEEVCHGLRVRYRYVAYAFIFVVLFVEQASRFGPPNAMINGMVKKNCSDPNDPGRFCWSENVQALVIGAFFYGYVFQFFVVGFASSFGFTLVLRITFFVSGLIMVTYPAMASVSPYLLVAAQIFRALGAGITMSYQYEIVRKWSIPSEAMYMISFNGSVLYFGMGSGSFLAGLTASSIGWEYYFYICGVLFWLILIFSMIFVPESPLQCRFVTEEERTLYPDPRKVQRQDSDRYTSYKKLLRRSYVWAFSLAGISHHLVVYNLFTTFPFYLDKVYNVSAKVLYWSPMFFGFTIGIAMIIISKIVHEVDKRMTWLKSRMLFTFIPFSIHGIGYLIIPNINSLPALFVVLFIKIFVTGTIYSGSLMTMNYDIDPINSSRVMSIFNSIGQLPGFLGPLFLVFMTQTDPETPNFREVLVWRWNRYFYVLTVMPVLALLGFVVSYFYRPYEWRLHPTLQGDARQLGSRRFRKLDEDSL